MHMEKTRLHGESLFSQLDWPFLVELWHEATSTQRASWYLPEMVAMSFLEECDEEVSSKLAAALGMAQLAIKLTDDLLDAEPGGVQEQVSAGEVANLSNVFQGGSTLLAVSAFPMNEYSRLTASTLAALAAETAQGQHLDVGEAMTEEAYWTAVKWKSTPFYKHAFGLGALLAKYHGVATDIHLVTSLGALFGEIVQVIDDLSDIMAETVAGDWWRSNNLLVLFAEMTDENGRFAQLKEQVQQGINLGQAQQYLIDCGAVAYCEHVVEAKYSQALEIMGALGVGEKRPLRELFEQHVVAVRLD